jgi:hypothetical protein
MGENHDVVWTLCPTLNISIGQLYRNRGATVPEAPMVTDILLSDEQAA